MDSFDQAGISPSTYFNGLVGALSSTTTTATTTHHHNNNNNSNSHHHHHHPTAAGTVIQFGPRKYKSRKERPCDFCRRRQVSCKIDVAPPCQLCQNHGRECTFVERPKKKRRPNNLVGGDERSVTVLDPTLTIDHSNGHMNNGFIPQYDERLFDGSLGHEHYLLQQSPTQIGPPGLDQDISPEFSSRSSNFSNGLNAERPLDSRSSRSARFIGETGESNPYLLRHYRYDEFDECTVSKLTYRRVKRASQVADDLSGEKMEPPVVFMLADDSLAQKGEPRIEEDVLAKARNDVASMFTDEEAIRLIGLYFRFVNPYFPILSKSELIPCGGRVSIETINALPLALLSALYATALPFMLYDDLLATTLVHNPPPPHTLYRISWLAVVQELHTPRLSTLQACLLLLQRAPTNRYTTDTPWKTSLVGWTVSLAQVLGLTRECGDWIGIPSWETSLRKRLWYGVYIMDKWASLGAGMPSHIGSEDFDVLPLMPGDCESVNDLNEHDSASMTLSGPFDADSHFRLLTELTRILSDIMDAYYSVKASQRTSRDFGLSLELARPIRSRLKAWNDQLPAELSLRHAERVDARGMAKLSGNSSLSLAYIIATMTLFRALLRPLENLPAMEEKDHGIVGSRLAVRAGAKECAKEVVEFVENLGRGALDAFWHSWSRANFAIASSFLMQLLITSDTPSESAEINDLVARWRWAMRIGSGSTGNGLMSLGLLRLDGLLLENGSAGQQQQQQQQQHQGQQGQQQQQQHGVEQGMRAGTSISSM